MKLEVEPTKPNENTDTPNRESKVVFEGRIYYRTVSGYFQTSGAKGARRLHRDFWESLHGPIPEGYVVHHINFDRANNYSSNLELKPNNEHSRIHSSKHWTERKANPLQKVCIGCGKGFQATYRSARYCSKHCSYKAYMALHRKELTAKKKSYYFAHRTENRDKRIDYARAYRLAHKNELRVSAKAYYFTHKDERREYKLKQRAERMVKI